MKAATLNGLRVTSAKVSIPYRGAWYADVSIDPNNVALVPTQGSATLLIGDNITLVGRIDPRSSGSFVSTSSVRVVGGLGWDNPVQALHFHNPNGVLTSTVYAATAPIVGEAVVDSAPTPLGVDFVRSNGPASRVFGDRPWFVDSAGVTRTGIRSAVKLDSSCTLLGWDPIVQRGEFSTDALILPGTTFTDPRIGQSRTVRDVEHSFSSDGSRAIVWCGSAPTSRLANALQTAVREFGGVQYLKTYKYRFVNESGTGLALQAVHRDAGLPDTIPVDVWTGVSGITTHLALSTVVLVWFIDGDPAQPIVLGTESGPVPLSTKIDATAEVEVGPSALSVEIAGGANFLATGSWAAGLAGALTLFVTGLDATSLPAKAATLLSTLGSLPVPATVKTKAT